MYECGSEELPTKVLMYGRRGKPWVEESLVIHTSFDSFIVKIGVRENWCVVFSSRVWDMTPSQTVDMTLSKTKHRRS